MKKTKAAWPGLHDRVCGAAVDVGSTTIASAMFGSNGSSTVEKASTPSEASACMNAGYVDNASDCDDTDGTVHPGATETPGDDVDDNCDDTIACYDDVDNDGYGTTTSAEVTSLRRISEATAAVSVASSACASNTAPRSRSGRRTASTRARRTPP